MKEGGKQKVWKLQNLTLRNNMRDLNSDQLYLKINKNNLLFLPVHVPFFPLRITDSLGILHMPQNHTIATPVTNQKP